jgi:hypothetical protein
VPDAVASVYCIQRPRGRLFTAVATTKAICQRMACSSGHPLKWRKEEEDKQILTLPPLSPFLFYSLFQSFLFFLIR